MKTYDLHITVDPKTLDKDLIQDPWKVHDIFNTQGPPHYIVSMKYTGDDAFHQLQNMVTYLEFNGVDIRRLKIERHFTSKKDLTLKDKGIVEVHYKYCHKDIPTFSQQFLSYLWNKKIALSINRSTGQPIFSIRFDDVSTFLATNTIDFTHRDFKDREMELVVMDNFNDLDNFWPMRTIKDGDISPATWSKCISYYERHRA